MGVDAVMMAMIPLPLSESDAWNAACDLAEAVGPDRFYLRRDAIWGPPRHALYITQPPPAGGWPDDTGDADDGIERCFYALPAPVPEGWTLVEVGLSGRYYGPGYERGDLAPMILAAEWIEQRFPGARVLYGGDSGDELEPFGPVERGALLFHWARVGHAPYSADWNMGNARRECGFCHRPMIQFGSGPSYASVSCLYCGDEHISRDGGATWVEKRANPREFAAADPFGTAP